MTTTSETEAKKKVQSYIRLARKWHKGWDEQWELAGKPHPYSEEYRSLARQFWFYKGVEFGKKVRK